MPIVADASRLITRLDAAVHALDENGIPAEATRAIAHETIKAVAANASSKLAGRSEQVGFDLPQFLINIKGPQRFHPAEYAILDTRKMGTADDYEKIGGEIFGMSLWHQGTQQGERFQRFILDKPDRAEDLADTRRVIWGSKTPQWFLLEYGTSQYPGTASPQPPAHFITAAKDKDKVFNEWKAIIRARIHAWGILT